MCIEGGGGLGVLGQRAPIDMSAGERTAFDKAYETGKRQMAANRLGLAIVDFERALALDPRSVKALNALGACYDELRRYDIAMSFYKQALAIEPQSADTLNNMAVSLAMAGHPADAEHILRKAASLDPESQTIRLNLAGMNSLGVARAAPKHAETPATLDAHADPKGGPRIERTGAQTYMIYLSKKPSPRHDGRLPASHLTHKATQRAGLGPLKKGHPAAGTHHAGLNHSRPGQKRAHAVARSIGIFTSVRARTGHPQWPAT